METKKRNLTQISRASATFSGWRKNPGARWVSILSHSEAQTMKIGKKLAHLLPARAVIALVGQLGAGKTTFVKGLARGAGVKEERAVKSPSFVILNRYGGKVPVNHFDLFRLNKLEEIEEIGFEEFLYGEGISVIEWAENVKGYLPREYLRIDFLFKGETKRKLKIRAIGKKYFSVIKLFKE